MTIFYTASAVLACLLALFQGVQNLQYSDIEALGISCPNQHKCDGQISNSTYLDRGCECDSACDVYGDCCIGAGRQTSGRADSSNLRCLNYGDDAHSGIYVVSECLKGWNGPPQVKLHCESSGKVLQRLTRPSKFTPVTSSSGSVTYKNIYCARCNDADFKSVKVFHYNLSCEGGDGTSRQRIQDQASYNQEEKKDSSFITDVKGNPSCKIIFELPSDVHESVRFCRANTISQCAPDWNQPEVAKSCGEYMAVVYHGLQAYRNPHCAICNNRAVSELSCTIAKRRESRGLHVHLPSFRYTEKDCPSNQKYDPFTKKCRSLRCHLPGYIVQNGRCVPSE